MCNFALSKNGAMTIIIANGEKPSAPPCIELLHNAETIVCCDGALRHLEQLGIQPTVIVGDGDSLTAEQRERYAPLIEADPSTDYNDLTKAFRYCEAHGLDDITILGGTGLREDHTLANLGLLLRYAGQFRVRMVTNYGIFSAIGGTTTFPSRAGEQVSIFSFTPNARLTFHGLRYPVAQRTFAELWEGASNESLGNQFTIELHDKGQVLVYQAFKGQYA